MALPNLNVLTPTLNSLTKGLFRYIANHPFIINTQVCHPLTDEQVFVERYRTYDGINLQSGLTCSIYADTPRASAEFKPYDLGECGQDMATYYINIKYSYNEVILGNVEDDPNLIEVPSWTEYGLGENLLTSNTKKNVTLEINPGIEIIQDYLQLTKWIIDDFYHFKEFPIPGIKSMEMVNQTVKTKRWEEDDTIYFQEGKALIRFDAYITRGWRDKLNPLYLSRTNINPTIN